MAVYSDDDLAAIIAAAGGLPPERRDDLRACLEAAATGYARAFAKHKKPTQRQIKDDLKKIEAALSESLAALHLPESISADDALLPLPAALRYGALQAQAALAGDGDASERLRKDIRGVYHLRDLARTAAARESYGRPAKRHEGDAALDVFLDALAGIWVEVFGRVPGVSVGAPDRSNEGQVTGPFVAFVQAAAQPVLGEKLKPSALRERWRRQSQRPMTVAGMVNSTRGKF